MTKETAMKILKELHNKSLFAERTALETLIPELAVSEDERIKKDIIRILKGELNYTSKEDANKYIAWLEKQGEQKPILDFKASNWYVSKVDGKIHDMTYNPTDKVEPKFKVGDYIVSDYCMGRVIEITNDAYLLDTGQGIPLLISCENNAHLWTIADAKDGDVVVDKSDGTIGIFQSIGHHPDGGSYNDPSYCFLHCRYDDGYFFADFENGNTIDSDDLIPATKEQRDLLFAKMEEAGYEWNAEKKELKKNEDEEYNGEDYGIDSLYHAQRILEKTLGKVDGYETDDGILEHKCAISAVKNLYKQKPAWSDEDELNLQGITDEIQANKSNAPSYDIKTYDRFLNWLKTLKDRVQPKNEEWSDEDSRRLQRIVDFLWRSRKGDTDTIYQQEQDVDWLKSIKNRLSWKPSKEQMETLEYYMHTLLATEHKEVLFGLYNDLKKL